MISVPYKEQFVAAEKDGKSAGTDPDKQGANCPYDHRQFELRTV
jgi:hypothetical protein